MIKSFALFAFALCLALPHAAFAGPRREDTKTTTSTTQKTFFPVTGAPGTLANVVLSAIKYGGLDMTSDQAIDDFAQLEYCDIYTQYRANEFDWRKVRVAMRQKIEIDKPHYPDTLYLERTEIFEQYDFNSGLLTMKPSTVLHTRALQLADLQISDSYCGAPMNHMPKQFIAQLDKQLNLEGIELSEDEARSTVAGLDVVESKPGERLAYSRFTVTFTGGAQPGLAHGTVKLNARLDDVTIYQDADYAHPFWSGLSSEKTVHVAPDVLGDIKFKGVDPSQPKIPAPAPLPLPEVK